MAAALRPVMGPLVKLLREIDGDGGAEGDEGGGGA